MSKKKKDFIYPYDRIKYFKDQYPNFWVEYDKLKLNFLTFNSVEEGDKYVKSFKDIICKMSEMKQYSPDEYIDVLNDVYEEAEEIARWRETKTVYTFTKELANLLCEGHLNDLDIPSQIREMLPCDAFLIRVEDKQNKHEFLVHKSFAASEDNVNLVPILWLTIEKKVKGYDSLYFTERFYLPCDGSESIEDWLNGIEKRRKADADADAEYTSIKVLRQYLQMLIYIVSINADIKSDQKQDSIFKRGPVILDKYNEIKKWEVGQTISKSIRLNRNNADRKYKEQYNSPILMSAYKKPHLRMSHWHHYWVGKKSDPKNRKLIIKWLAPIYVNFDSFDNLPIKSFNVTE